MKLAIFGSYNGTSIGDTAILLGLLRAISLVEPQAEVTVLSMGPINLSRDAGLIGDVPLPMVTRANAWRLQELPILRSILWRVNRWIPIGDWLGPINRGRCRGLLENQDLMIVGGGNLLMDLFRNNVPVLKTICDAALEARVPYAFLGVGAGPVSSVAGREGLQACLAGAHAVYVRDEASRALCREVLGRQDTQRAPDLAFALNGWWRADAERDGLVLNVAGVGGESWPWRDERLFSDYLDGLVRLARTAVTMTRPRRVDIVTTNTSVDVRAAHRLMESLTQRDVNLSCPVDMAPCRDVTGALEAFSHARLAITTRLHAAILASLAGCRVLPIAYDPKVANVLEEERIASASIGIADLADRTRKWSAQSSIAVNAATPRLHPILDQVVASVESVVKIAREKQGGQRAHRPPE